MQRRPTEVVDTTPTGTSRSTSTWATARAPRRPGALAVGGRAETWVQTSDARARGNFETRAWGDFPQRFSHATPAVSTEVRAASVFPNTAEHGPTRLSAQPSPLPPACGNRGRLAPLGPCPRWQGKRLRRLPPWVACVAAHAAASPLLGSQPRFPVSERRNSAAVGDDSATILGRSGMAASRGRVNDSLGGYLRAAQGRGTHLRMRRLSSLLRPPFALRALRGRRANRVKRRANKAHRRANRRRVG